MLFKYLYQENIYNSHILIQGFDSILFIFFPKYLIKIDINNILLFMMKSIGIALLCSSFLLYKVRKISIKSELGQIIAYYFLTFHGLSSLLLISDIIYEKSFPFRILALFFHMFWTLTTLFNLNYNN